MARETLPNTDGQDGGISVIRERLDGQPPTGWRAPLARWVEGVGAWFGAVATPALSRSDHAAAPLISGARRLTGRQKLARGAVVFLTVALALFALLGGPSAALSALSSLHASLFPPPPELTLSASDYALQQLPPPAQHLPRIALAPEVAQPAAALACWVGPHNMPLLGQVAVYRTDNFAHSWRRLNFPQVYGQDCALSADAAGSAGALVSVPSGYSSPGECEALKLLRTLDGGATWIPVSWIRAAAPMPCDAQFTLDGDAIFAWSTQPLLAGAQPASASGRLIVTRDNGATWEVADSGLADDMGLTLVGFRSGGRILATMPDASGPPGAGKLVESRDYGATWRDLGVLPGAFPVVYVTTDPSVTDGGGWGPLYVIARPLIGGVPADASHTILAMTTIGSRWTPIPLPPLAAGDTSNADVTFPIVVGVGPAESLLVEHGIVSMSYGAQLGPSRRLWAWSAGLGRWLPDPQPTLGNADLLGWGWNHGDLTLWVTSLQLGVPPTLLLFTRTYKTTHLGPAR